jgi:hypothetical protein
MGTELPALQLHGWDMSLDVGFLTFIGALLPGFD